MKFLVVLSLLAIASASTLHPLSDITGATSTVTVTALYPDAGAAPTLTSIAYPVTYDSSATNPAAFTITSGGASYVGNNTVVAGLLSLTNNGDTVNIQFGASLVPGTNTVTFGSANYYPKFLNTANYAATVTLYTSTFGVFVVTLSTAFPVVAATKYTPPTVSAYHLVSPQSGGCGSTSCTGYLNGTIAATSRTGSYWTNYLRSSHASNGVLFSSTSTFTSGASDFNVNTLQGLVTTIGGVINNVWVAAGGGTGATISTVAPKNDNLAISGQFLDSGRITYFNEAAMAAFQASVQINQGGTDVTAPTCSVLTVSPTTVNTVAASVPVTVTLTCVDDNGGSGLWTTGYFGTASVTSGSARTQGFSQFVTGTYMQQVPAYVAGTFTIVGVFAVDNAGNAALYGSCGGVAGFDSLGCAGGGSGSSSASTVVFSLFSVLLAVLVLFA